MGSLREELETDQKVYVGRVPVLFGILDSMTEEERQELLDVLNDRTVSSPAIHRVLTKRGHKVGLTAIKMFRSGGHSNVYSR